jgi:hypothetical protein
MLPAAVAPADGVSAAARAGQWRSGAAGGFLSPVPGGVAAGSAATSHPSLLALAARLRAQQHPSLQQQHHGQSPPLPPPLPSL